MIGFFWRGFACLGSHEYKYARRIFAYHNHLLLCMGIIALNANDNGMNLDDLCIVY